MLGEGYTAFKADTGIQSPAEYMVEFPNQRRYVVFKGCRTHACSDFYAYLLVDVDAREIEIIWIQKDTFTKFAGANAELFSQNNVFGWLPDEPSIRFEGPLELGVRKP